MNNDLVHVEYKQVIADSFYARYLMDVFRNSQSFLSASSFPADAGWLFVVDGKGRTIAGRRIGDTLCSLEKSYPVLATEPYIEELDGNCTICVPVLEDVWFPGYVGVIFSNAVDSKCGLSFVQGFASVFRLVQEQYVAKSISACLKAVNETLHLDCIMETISERLAASLDQTECLVMVYDAEQDISPHWIASKKRIRRRDYHMMRDIHTVYKQITSLFTSKRTQLTNENSNILTLLDNPDVFEESYVISPLRHGDQIIGVIAVLRSKGQSISEREKLFVERFAKDLSLAVYNAMMYMRLERDEQKRTLLFEVTKKIHSSINVEDVLDAVIKNTKKLYPKMQVDLWLSHDTFSKLPVKQFTFDVNDISSRAFMEGRTMLVQSQGERALTLASPLRGKQGIYGVIELYTNESLSLHPREIEYITMLADTAGSAFENAQLYQQSQNLIKELLLIDEMTSQLNKNIRLDDLLASIIHKLTETFRAEHCCILSRVDDSPRFIIQASTDKQEDNVFEIKEDCRLRDLLLNKESLLLADASGMDEIVSLFSCRSLMAVPFIDNNKVEGAIVLTDSEPNRYTFDDFKRLQMLARHVKVAVTNASLHAEVERMVITDNLTGLYSRKYLYDIIRQSYQRDACGALILIDVDHFKNVNDTYGHQTGDEILIQVADVLNNSIRLSDIAARWGGEEMAIYLPRVGGDIARQVAGRLRVNVMNETTPKVTISGGIAVWSRDSSELDVEILFQKADEALYRAKRSGRNRMCEADEMNK
ncbi:diguanylate cyclase (GGDEF)-like protein [Aneurinibacillus soli]|uniref:Putative diguanylate cyclase YdaM n=1 Tax=Aneurinibacillus soli TaxID=1500254 RepID=A0A0U5AZW5_9BACL|nr:diguanylate cyclase [Aneurinibacillus soli]PYE59698.1 diguanylate cyclase (GGDEF)-like protein [Aneurinibacillus soli]BAU29301.1 putative diguanylate cyclase YdaM [Aneurinibacillus soli]